MKQLSIEEKAKRYDDAIDKIKYVMGHGVSPTLNKEDLQDIFPELKESEDEKVRKKLINLVKKSYEQGGYALHKWEADEMLAWLEKQSEQKPKTVDKVEPKFKVGDWVVYDGWTTQIKEVYEDGYSNIHQGFIPKKREEEMRLWTIKDAKDGDVLSYNDGHGNDCIELIKSITDKKIEFWFCLSNGNHYEVFDGIVPYTNIASREDANPATKEQRDTLMKAMADAGYTFDFKRKN